MFTNTDQMIQNALQAEGDREGDSAGEVGESILCFIDLVKTFRFYVNCNRKQGCK